LGFAARFSAMPRPFEITNDCFDDAHSKAETKEMKQAASPALTAQPARLFPLHGDLSEYS
jgi:hypothetical protein